MTTAIREPQTTAWQEEARIAGNIRDGKCRSMAIKKDCHKHAQYGNLLAVLTKNNWLSLHDLSTGCQLWNHNAAEGSDHVVRVDKNGVVLHGYYVAQKLRNHLEVIFQGKKIGYIDQGEIGSLYSLRLVGSRCFALGYFGQILREFSLKGQSLNVHPINKSLTGREVKILNNERFYVEVLTPGSSVVIHDSKINSFKVINLSDKISASFLHDNKLVVSLHDDSLKKVEVCILDLEDGAIESKHNLPGIEGAPTHIKANDAFIAIFTDNPVKRFWVYSLQTQNCFIVTSIPHWDHVSVSEETDITLTDSLLTILSYNDGTLFKMVIDLTTDVLVQDHQYAVGYGNSFESGVLIGRDYRDGSLMIENYNV